VYRNRFSGVPAKFFMYGLEDPAERDFLRQHPDDAGAWQLEILRTEDANVLLNWTATNGVSLYMDAAMDDYPANSEFVQALREALSIIDQHQGGGSDV
jgi:hypothetical protein